MSNNLINALDTDIFHPLRSLTILFARHAGTEYSLRHRDLAGNNIKQISDSQFSFSPLVGLFGAAVRDSPP